MRKCFRPTFVFIGYILLILFFVYCVVSTIVVYKQSGLEAERNIIFLHIIFCLLIVAIFHHRFIREITIYSNMLCIYHRNAFQKNFSIKIQDISKIRYRRYILTIFEMTGFKYLNDDFDSFYDSVCLKRTKLGGRVIPTHKYMIIHDFYGNTFGISVDYFDNKTLCELEKEILSVNPNVIFEESMTEFEKFERDFCIKHGDFDEAEMYDKMIEKKEQIKKKNENHIDK